MTTPENVLAIDVGTQSVRALVFDARGRLVDGARLVYEPAYVSPRPGWAEQDPDYYWLKTAEACAKLWSQGRVAPDSLAGAALTGQRGTVVNLDQDGQPLRPAILWLDQRRAARLPVLPVHWRLIFKTTGLSPTLRHLQAEAEANWIKENQPQVWQKTRHFLLLSGYLTFKLTGQYVDSTGCQVGYIPFDYRRQKWSGPLAWKCHALEVDPETLPRLVPPGDRLGSISQEAASLTGLPRGLPLISGASDKACEALGAGCLEPHQGCIGYGTTATINVNSRRYIEPIALVPPYPSAKTGEYNLEVQVFRGLWLVTWFKEQFAQAEEQAAQKLGLSAETLLEELASKTPPGAMGLVLQPYWTPGVRYPGQAAKGSLIGFGSVHKKEHVYRAILEGLAYALRQGKEMIERKTKTPIRELHVCGGGSRSDLLMQISADVFARPAARPSLYETSGLGAAILAAVGSGAQPDLKAAVREMTGQGDVFEPRPEAVRIYGDYYQEVYCRMYPKLRGLYQAIRRISGYPQAPGRP